MSVRYHLPETHHDCVRVATRLRTLLEATRRLSESIDYAQTLVNVVEFVAQRFASYAILDVVDEEGRIERVAVAHSDPTRTPLLERISEFAPRRELATHPVARAIVLGEETLEAIDERWIVTAAIDREHAQTMRDLEMRQLLVVPVLARTGDVIGALSCALDAHAQRACFDADDVTFACELGLRAGVALENARLYEREHRIAGALQAASLPQRLPAIDGLRLDACYRPSSAEATIGGDWFDAFELLDGRVVLTIGDVVGHGLHAAITMTKLRQAMQAAAMVRADPAAMLEVAERTLLLHDASCYATALAAVYDRDARTLTLASAGHPAPLLLRDGRIESCGILGLMLGVAVGSRRRTTCLAVEPETSVVFYTDGLTELERDIEAGERRLFDALERPGIMLVPRPARAIVAAVIGASVPSDDIALMTMTTGR
ncbi:MAG: hypothetical protein NVSMB21_01490 [Vulcanimicrobiaceae bacterium]